MAVTVGVPREIKPLEGRVALTPEAAAAVAARGHRVCVQSGAGVPSGYPDAAYADAGIEVLPDAESLYAAAGVIVKVKEPVDPEVGLLRPDHLLFCYLHLAALPELKRRLCGIGLTAVAFETVAEHGRLPILAPMSEVAGRIAVQVGARLLSASEGGRGVLLGGVPGASRGRVTVLGAGMAGASAAMMAAGMGAWVDVLDLDPVRLEALHNRVANIETRLSTPHALDELLPRTDILVGAVLLPGAHAPRVVNRAQVAGMRSGSVIADIAVDQGGCIETTRPTTYKAPTYVEEGVTHFCVTNMPGAVPRTASQALAATVVPYLLRLLGPDWRSDPVLRAAINVAGGEVMHPAL